MALFGVHQRTTCSTAERDPLLEKQVDAGPIGDGEGSEHLALEVCVI